MKPLLHVANTSLEWELESSFNERLPPKEALASALEHNSIYLQLQFLPFLYAAPGDAVLVSHPPSLDYASVRQQYGLPDLKIINIRAPSLEGGFELAPWGHSKLLARWASSHSEISYTIPNWPVVQEVNSKAFSFQNAPKLPHAELLTSSKQANEWLKATSGKRVLKTCYGVSGKGHLLIEADASSMQKKIDVFLNKEWALSRPVIAEPWVDRLLDFSTQWSISPDKEISFLGSTRCENAPNGQYRSNQVGNEDILFSNYLPFLKEHKTLVKPVLEKMADMGYFGAVGIDAMVYRNCDTQQVELHPIVEINARKTMGWAALAFQQRHCPDQNVEFQFSHHPQGLLPSSIIAGDGSQVFFKRNIQVRYLFTFISSSR